MNPVIGLSLGRVALGAVALLKPELIAKGLGGNAPSPLMTQAFASREMALGAATLLTWGRARRTMVMIGIAVDGADVAATYVARESEAVPREVGTGLMAVAGAAVLTGFIGLCRRTRKTEVVAA